MEVQISAMNTLPTDIGYNHGQTKTIDENNDDNDDRDNNVRSIYECDICRQPIDQQLNDTNNINNNKDGTKEIVHFSDCKHHFHKNCVLNQKHNTSITDETNENMNDIKDCPLCHGIWVPPPAMVEEAFENGQTKQKNVAQQETQQAAQQQRKQQQQQQRKKVQKIVPKIVKPAVPTIGDLVNSGGVDNLNNGNLSEENLIEDNDMLNLNNDNNDYNPLLGDGTDDPIVNVGGVVSADNDDNGHARAVALAADIAMDILDQETETAPAGEAIATEEALKGIVNTSDLQLQDEVVNVNVNFGERGNGDNDKEEIVSDIIVDPETDIMDKAGENAVNMIDIIGGNNHDNLNKVNGQQKDQHVSMLKNGTLLSSVSSVSSLSTSSGAGHNANFVDFIELADEIDLNELDIDLQDYFVDNLNNTAENNDGNIIKEMYDNLLLVDANDEYNYDDNEQNINKAANENNNNNNSKNNNKDSDNQVVNRRVYASFCSGKVLKLLIRDIWNKRKCYLPLITHFVDQMTDIGVILNFYFIYQNELKFGASEYCPEINGLYLFIASIFAFLFYRLVSSIIIFQQTKKVSRFFLQLFDFELYRALYLNYKLNANRPTNPQRWIQSLEAMLEAFPQTLIQLFFVVKVGKFILFICHITVHFVFIVAIECFYFVLCLQMVMIHWYFFRFVYLYGL